MINIEPIRLKPCYKEYIWGGKLLKSIYRQPDAPNITAESWVLAERIDGHSVAAEGLYAGKDLAELSQIYSDPTSSKKNFMGNHCKSSEFPILVKLIDASQNLSIQVHPSDETALKNLGEQGKAEMWYIVDCKPDSFIYLGFSKMLSKDEFISRAEAGSICDVLNKVPVVKGDVFSILPGTIHAIGEGIVIAEIQQNSNTTFRVYDYKRTDAQGNYRELHLKRAVDTVSFEPILPEKCRANCTANFDGYRLSEMFSCEYFKAFCIDIYTQADLVCKDDSFQHLVCVGGDGVIHFSGQNYRLGLGDSFFIPAGMGQYIISGMCKVLITRI